jgi:hypothetical protein
MNIVIHQHALERMKERGATLTEVNDTILNGEKFPAKFNRSAFRCNFTYNDNWNGTFYNNKQIEAIAVNENSKWIVITVIVKYF